MTRGIGAIVKFIIGICIICVVCRFLGITWADVDNFVDNGMLRAMRVLSLLKGSAHMPL